MEKRSTPALRAHPISELLTNISQRQLVLESAPKRYRSVGMNTKATGTLEASSSD